MAKKYISEFVKRMRLLSLRAHGKYVWISRNDKGIGLTYNKKLHGDLK